MSIEDPRMSAVDGEHVSHDFISDIHEDAALQTSAARGVEVAQADNSQQTGQQTEKTDRVPDAAVVQASARAGEIVPDQNNVAHLAAGTSIDDIHVEGNNLVLVQADGTEIVIVNGALHVPTFLLGEVELPQQAVIAALEQSNINVAAGPDGSYSASSSPSSSGAEFQDTMQQDAGDPTQLAQLLGDTQQADGSLNGRPDEFDGIPVITTTSLSTLTENESDQGFETRSVDGRFGFLGGRDFGTISSIGLADSLNMNEGTQTGTHVNLTSGGATVVIATDGLTMRGTADGQLIFVLTVTNKVTGAFTFTQYGPLDHPDKGEAGAADTLRLQFSYTVTDKDGDHATGIGSIDIRDDAPSIAASTATETNSVNENVLPDGTGAVHGESQGAPFVGLKDVSLGINWGADAYNAGGTNDRSVAFDVKPGATALTSDGVTIYYSLSEDGTVLTATKGAEGPTVFTVKLSDLEKGSYTFELKGNIDHAAPGSADDGSRTLNFGFTAKDSDGDPASSSFNVRIVDDQPQIGKPDSASVNEDDLPGGNDHGRPESTRVSGGLHVSWGSDDNNQVGSTNDRSVAFDVKTGATALSSDGVTIYYKLSPDGTVLTATKGSEGPTVFIVKLSDQHSGSYTFELKGNIDHAAPGSADDGSRTLNFGFTAKDSDGDPASSSFNVRIVDDQPQIGKPDSASVNEDDLPGGNDHGRPESTRVSGGLHVSWGSDDNNQVGSTNDRSVAFDVKTGATALSSDGVTIYYKLSPDGTVLTATKGSEGPTVFIVKLSDQHSGSYTFELKGNIDHASSGPNDDSRTLNFGFVAKDSDGDTASSSFNVRIVDDQPVATRGSVTVTADEGDIQNILSHGNSPSDGTADGSSSDFSLIGLGSAATVSGSIAPTVSFGADGAAAGGGFSFAANATSTLSAMQLSSKGGELSYVVFGNTIIGYVDNGNHVYSPLFDRPVLSLTLNSDGSFKYQQYDQLDHAAGDGNDLKAGSNGTVSGIDFGSVIKATDGDGDSVTLGGKFVVKVTDDVPTVSISLTGSTVTHDETTGVNPGSDDSVLATAKSAFTGLENTERLHALGYARNGVAIVNSGSSVGTDEPKSASLTLQVTDAASGLRTTSGEAITLHEENGLVVGRDEDGDAVFAISLDSSGHVSIAQYQAIQHPIAGQANELVNLAGKISASISATDFDGDTATKSIDIGGQIQFRDDAPVFSGSVTVTADEGDIQNILSHGNSPSDGTADGSSSDFSLIGLGSAATVSGSIAPTVSFGADGAAAGGGFSFAANATSTLSAMQLSSKGGELSYVVFGNTIIGYVDNGNHVYSPLFDRPVLSLTLNSDGSFKYQQYDQLDHAAGDGNDLKAGSNGTVSGIDFGSVIKATDGDGDSVTLGGKFVVKVTDDVPTVSISLTGSTVTHDETTGVNPGSDDTTSSSVRSIFGSFEGAAHVSALGYAHERNPIVSYGSSEGADEKASVSLKLEVTNSVSGLETTSGKVITLSLENGLVVGRDTDGKPVFAISLDSGGRVSIAQYQAIHHPIDSNPNDLVNLTGKISAVVTATDFDGDTATKSIDIGKQIQFRDDAPVLTGTPATATVSEAHLTTDHNPGGIVQTDFKSLNVSWGADNAGARVDFATDAEGNPIHPMGLTSDGVQLSYELRTTEFGEKQLVAFKSTETSDNPVFIVALTSPGNPAYGVTLFQNIDHGPNSNSTSLEFTIVATDGDGDKITVPVTIDIKDDSPVIGALQTVTVHEAGHLDLLSNGSFEQDSLAGGQGGVISDVKGNYTYGAPAGWTLTGGAGGVYAPSGNIVDAAGHDGGNVAWLREGATLARDTGTTLVAGQVYSIHFDVGNRTDQGFGGGTVSLIATHNGETVVLSHLDLPVPADGKWAPVDLNTPLIGSDYAGWQLHVEIKQTSDGNQTLIDDVELQHFTAEVAQGSLAIGWGADNDVSLRSVGFDGVQNVSGLASNGQAIHYEFTPGGSLLKALSADGRLIFTVELSKDTGQFKFTLLDSLDQSGASSAVKFNFTATDADGDKASSSFTVNVADTAPSLLGQLPVGMVSEDGVKSTGNQSLGVSWGADDNNSGITNNRSVSFGNSQPMGLFSNGNPVTYIFNAERTVLTAMAGGQAVFIVTLTDRASGAYAFELLQPLDHAAPVNGSQFLDLKFGFTATDSDGDTAPGTFTVRVDAAGSIGSIHYDNLTTGVFVNLSNSAQTVGTETVAAHMAYDRTGVDGGNVVGHDALGATVDAFGSKGNDILIGGDEGNRMVGNSGDDLIIGGKGSDTLEGGEGDDTLKLGADITDAKNYGPRTIDLGNGHFEKLGLDGLAGTTDAIIGGTGHDTVVLDREGSAGFVLDALNPLSPAFSGIEEVVGTDGNDIILVKADYTSDLPDGGIKIDGGDGNDAIGGGKGADTLIGGKGDDLIAGLDGDDTITGGEGNDRLYGGNGNDTVSGGDGNDVIEGGGGADNLSGGDGNDRIIAGTEQIANGGFKGPAEVIVGNNGQKADLGGGWTVSGGSVDLVVSQGSLNADFPAGVNAVDMQGVSTGAIAQAFATEAGKIYTVSFLQSTNPDLLGHTSETTSAVTVSAGAASQTFTDCAREGTTWGTVASTFIERTFTFTATGSETTLTFSAVGASSYGSLIAEVSVSQVPVGTVAGATIDGGAGNDILTGGAGNDVIHGGIGNDLIRGGDGNDTITGDDGDDFLSGGRGGDNLSGGAGNDTFVVGTDAIASGTRVFDLGNGTHLDVSIQGLAGTGDTISGGSGYDKINLDNGTAPGFVYDAYSFPGVISGIEEIEGTAGNDVILVAADYTSDATGGGITIDGGAGNDKIGGGKGNDHLIGGSGDDLISGLAGDDTLEGGAGNDTIYGGTGNDTLRGGDGDDMLDGGKGDDALMGGAGDDVFEYAVGDGSDTIDGGDGNNDTLLVVGGPGDTTFNINAISLGGTSHLAVNIESGGQTAIADADNYEVATKNVEDWIIDGGDGDDKFVVTGSLAGTGLATSTLSINGSAGNDTLDVSGLASIGQHIVFNAGAGTDDTIIFGADWKDATAVKTDTGFTITIGNQTYDVSGTEKFVFSNGTATIDNLLEAAPTGVTGTLVVAENAAAGASVGTLKGVDINAALDKLTYAFVDAQGQASQTSADGRFRIEAATGAVTVAADASIDFETTPTLTEKVRVTDVHGQHFDQNVSISVTDVNEAPTAVTFANVVSSIDENTAIGDGIKVATLAVIDDALGTNSYSLSGADAVSFTIKNGNELYYIGASPDFETKGSYTVVVNTNDALVGNTPDASKTLTLTVNDLAEAPLAAVQSDPLYAFTDGRAGEFPAGEPTKISLNLASLFSGTGVGTTYAYEVVRQGNGTSNSGWDNWLTRSGNILSGDPDTNRDGLYILKVTATTGSETASTYVAISAIENEGWKYTTSPIFSDDGDLYKGLSSVSAGSGDDVIIGSASVANTLIGGSGSDQIYGGAKDDTIYGGDATFFGYPVSDSGNATNYISAGGGDDTIFSGGRDYIFGGSGNDQIYGFDTDKVIDGGDGSDTLKVNLSTYDFNDAQLGDAGIVNVEKIVLVDYGTANFSHQTENLTITGSSGDDTITGGFGDDTIDGGSGKDKLFGGAGNDTFVVNGFTSGETIDGGTGDNRIVLGNNTTADFSNGSIANIQTILGSAGTDNITLTAAQWASLSKIDLGGQAGDKVNIEVSGNVDFSSFTFPTVTGVGAQNLVGSSSNDTITLTGAQLDAILLGGGTIDLGGGSNTIKLTSPSAVLNGLTGGRLANVDTITAASASAGVTIDLAKQSEAFAIVGSNFGDNITGGSNGDVITGGLGDDILTGNSGSDTFKYQIGDGADTVVGGGNGGGGDTLAIAGGNADDVLSVVVSGSTVTQFNGGTVTGIENVAVDLGGGANTLSYAGTTQSVSVDLDGNTKSATGFSSSSNFGSIVNVTGGSNADTITGSSADNIIIGGKGADTLDGGSGKDTFAYYQGDTAISIGGNDKARTVTGYDTINNFTASSGGNQDKLVLANDVNGSAPHIVANGVSIQNDGVSSTYALTGGGTAMIQSHSITDGIITFSTADQYASNSLVTISSVNNLAVVLDYLQHINLGSGGTVAFKTSFSGNDTFVYEQVGATPNLANDILINLNEQSLSSLKLASAGGSNAVVAGHIAAIDPIILDLDHNGVALTSLDHGVQFDINADGHKDQIAWTAGSDGILAYDVDGNGKIDNGSEIFSPHFAGGTYVDGLAALATLDSNHDGKIDAGDDAFSKLTVWQDLNHNGITDSGELSSLADHAIASLSLEAHASGTEINGQSILADGSYTLTDGSTGHFVEVAFDTTLGGESGAGAYSLIGSDGDDTLSGSGGMYTISGGAGADTFVLDTDALADIKLVDVITDYKAGEGDTLDVSKLLDSLLGREATETDALSSVRATVSGADTVVSVNANGGWHDVAVLQNTTEAVKILFDDKHDAVTAPHVG